MGIETWLSPPLRSETNATLTEVNKALSVCGMKISVEEAQTLSERRAEALADTERVEFGQPAIVTIAEAVAASPHLSQENVGQALAELQDAFYTIREELPADVPDAEIAEALRGCLDECGDIAMVTSMPTDEVMSFSAEYVRMTEATASDQYRIVDDEGRTYYFDASEWDYDKLSDGWNGERWADGWDD